MSPHALQTTVPARVSLIRSIFSHIAFEGFPIIRPRPSRRDSAEGILAPRSPAPAPSPLARRPSSPFRSSTYPSAPPRSPGPRIQELDTNSLSTNSSTNFQLHTPPRRATLRQNSMGHSLGLGTPVRRSSLRSDIE